MAKASRMVRTLAVCCPGSRLRLSSQRSIRLTGRTSARGSRSDAREGARAANPRSAWLVSQIGRKPAFDLGDAHAFAAGVVFRLVARDAVDREVARLRMGEVEAGDARRGVHCEMFSQPYANCSLCVKQLK